MARVLKTSKHYKELAFALSITTGVSGTYTSGQLIGHKVTLSGTMDSLGGQAIIKQLIINDASNFSVSMDAVFFNDNPASSTLTNKTALTIDPNDLSKISTIITMSAWHAFATTGHCERNNLDIPLQLASSQNTLYLGLIARTAFTGTVVGAINGKMVLEI